MSEFMTRQDNRDKAYKSFPNEKCKACGLRIGSHMVPAYLLCWKELQVRNLRKENVSEFTGV